MAVPLQAQVTQAQNPQADSLERQSLLPLDSLGNIQWESIQNQQYDPQSRRLTFHYLIQGLVNGAFWILIIYNLFIFLKTRDKSYLFYSLYMVAITLFLMYRFRSFFFLFGIQDPRLLNLVWVLSIQSISLLYVLFLKYFVGPENISRKILRLIQYFVGWKALIFLVLVGLILFTEQNRLINQVSNPIITLEFILVYPLVIWYLIKVRNRSVRYVLLGSLFIFVLGFLTHMLYQSGITYLGHFSVFYFSEMGFLLEVLCFSLALGEKVRIMEQTKTQAEQEKIQAQREQLAIEQGLVERLKRVDKLKDQFLANTSHELRTPLHGIIGLSESLQERLKKAEDQQDLSLIISSSKRLASLVNDILDFSKLQNRDLKLKPKAVDVYALVDLVLHLSRPMVRNKALALDNQVPKDLPPVLADESRFQQILFNLIGNAIKFTEKGSICVSAIQKDKLIEISVADTGIGIAPENFEQAFAPFEQLDGSDQRAFGGTGLGLGISKQLVELHGGKMWLKSAEGEGATFSFSLPISESAGVHPISTPIKPSEILESKGDLVPTKPFLDPIASKKSKVRILIVDDEPINLQVIMNHLHGLPYQIHSALNGADALKIIETEPKFDLVLLDLMMPFMSGYEVCRKIRERFLPSELPVIMITAKDQIQDLVEGFEMGANDYLTKPFSKEEFLARVRIHLNLHHINRVTNRFVPNAFLRALGKPNLMELELGDQVEKEVTVFFSDIRDYTALAESMGPKETFHFVNAYAGRMGPVIQKNHGFVNQYLGDGIMAIFEQKPDDALKAAIEMQQAIQDYNEERANKGREALQVGMGMHSGSLIMGIIGDEVRTEPATISDTVNTAARIESLTKSFGVKILLSEASYLQLSKPESYDFRYLGRIAVKGKREPIGIFECLNGYVGEEKELKMDTLKQFRSGIEAFYERKFPLAIRHFKKVSIRDKQDLTTRRFLTQAVHYMAAGVPENWTGAEMMK